MSNIEVLDFTPSGQEYDYFRPKWTITIEMDQRYNVPVLNIDFDGWYHNAVHLWPENNAQHESFLVLEINPLSSGNVSSLDTADSGYDTVF